MSEQIIDLHLDYAYATWNLDNGHCVLSARNKSIEITIEADAGEKKLPLARLLLDLIEQLDDILAECHITYFGHSLFLKIPFFMIPFMSEVYTIENGTLMTYNITDKELRCRDARLYNSGLTNNKEYYALLLCSDLSSQQLH